MDKNNALIEYLLTCEPIHNSTLYFNFANVKDAAKQFVTLVSSRNINIPYIDGSVKKRLSMTVQSFLSITDNPIVTVSGFDNENISDMSEIQALIDWIDEQNQNHNYPNFGEDCEVEEITTTSNTPRLDMIDITVTPPIARYSFTIRVDYIDKSTKIWSRRQNQWTSI